MDTVWKAWLGVAVLITALYYVITNTPESRLMLFNGVGLLALALVTFAIKRNQPTHRAAWTWIAAGLGSFLLADVVYYAIERSGPPPFPSVADVFYLSMYALVIVGLTKLTPSGESAGAKTGTVEAAVVATALAAALWILYVDDIVNSGLESTQLAVSLAYPLMNVLLVAAAIRLAVVAGLQHRSVAVLMGAVTALTIADTSFNVYLNNGTFRTGLYIDALWIAFYALVAVAALQPAARTKTPEADPVPTGPTARELASVLT